MTGAFTESVVEQAALAWLESLDWRVTDSLEIAPCEPGAGRTDYAQVVLEGAADARSEGEYRNEPRYADCVHT